MQKQRRVDLNRHVGTVHEGPKPFKCTVCGVGFTQKPSMKAHTAWACRGPNSAQF